MIFDKPIELLTKNDLTSLIENQVRESVFIEYKRDMYGNTNKAKKEFLKDVTALANASGGFLLIGVDEENSLPVKLVGVSNEGKELSAIIQLCSSCIQERIQGLKAFPIPIGNEKHVIIIEVPPSIRIPHMVSYDKHSSFWKRQGDQNVPMNIEDIRNAFIRGHEGMRLTEKILKDAYEEYENIEIPHGARIFIMIIPVFSQDNLIDTTQLEIKHIMQNLRPEKSLRLRFKLPTGEVQPFMHGVETISSGDDRSKADICQIFHNGLFRVLLQKNTTAISHPDNIIHAPQLSDYFINSLDTVRRIYKYAKITGPFITQICIDGNKNPALYIGPMEIFGRDTSEQFTEKRLTVPSYQFSHIDNILVVAKNYLDALWRCFHEERCPYFDENGNYTVWNR